MTYESVIDKTKVLTTGIASHTAAAGNRGRPVWAYEPIRCRKARAVARASSTLATT